METHKEKPDDPVDNYGKRGVTAKVMLNSKLSKSVDSVIAELRQSQEFIDYREQKRIANSNRETASLIERARSLQNRLMEIPEDERNSDYAESLQNEYEEITENTAVYEFARCEAIYMTMLQEVLGSIIEQADIDI